MKDNYRLIIMCMTIIVIVFALCITIYLVSTNGYSIFINTSMDNNTLEAIKIMNSTGVF